MSSLGGHDFHSFLYAHRQSILCPSLSTKYILPIFLISFLAIHSYCPILHRLCQHQNFHYPQNLGFDCPTWWLSPPTFLPYLLTHAHYIFNLLKPSSALPPPLSQSTPSPIFTSVCVEHGRHASSIQAFPEKALNSLTLLYLLHISRAKPSSGYLQ